ncbi:cytochrome C peroxidase [Chitinophaga sp. Mgbs1]|uniref:Cytochrome C peroxidase n=1 Tax=Chitinophaga solisilvae TaxID=1233460 RepID=A0A3S1JKI0_9BACT|nr:cytochrome C peroxidase [Chitinophaga solisilvae]
MKKAIFVVSITLSAIVLINCHAPVKTSTTDNIRQYILDENALFARQLEVMSDLIRGRAEQEQVQHAFAALRHNYKKMEWAVAYYMPETARFTNGPALDEIEAEENTILEAEGLQVLEEYLYPVPDTSRTAEMLRMIKKLSNKSLAIRTYFEANTISLPQIMDALRSQVFRIITLGITGFDTPVSGTGLTESAWALEGIAGILDQLKPQLQYQDKADTLLTKIAAARTVLAAAGDRNHFNYLDFITSHANRISEELYLLRIAENIPAVAVTKAIRDNAPTLFAADAFNPDAFVPGSEYKQSADKAALGKMLFSNPVLSGNGSRSCATCHQSERAFTDGLKTATAIAGGSLSRNTPSLNYSNFQHGQFWDMRRPDLETQAEDVITNKQEMHGSLADISQKLNADIAYKSLFKKIYKTDTIATWQLQNVLAAYIRSLSVFSSGFDRYMRGEKTAMTASQQQGFNLFTGKGKCATCHFIPLFNGTVPPDFTKTEAEVLGVASDFTNKKPDTDRGRGYLHGTIPQLQNAFKTPTLRNIAQTAPYMHHGGYQTLQQVMTFYNKGGGTGLGFKTDNQTLPADQLQLTQEETDKIIDFMQALTDTPQ